MDFCSRIYYTQWPTTGIQSHILIKRFYFIYQSNQKRENAFPNNFGKNANKYQILRIQTLKK